MEEIFGRDLSLFDFETKDFFSHFDAMWHFTISQSSSFKKKKLFWRILFLLLLQIISVVGVYRGSRGWEREGVWHETPPPGRLFKKVNNKNAIKVKKFKFWIFLKKHDGPLGPYLHPNNFGKNWSHHHIFSLNIGRRGWGWEWWGGMT